MMYLVVEHSSDTVPSDSAAGADDVAAGAFLGRYQVREPLGAGGMGRVYLAWDPELERTIALKLLREDQVPASAGRQARLVREAQAQARLSHPNVVPILDVGSVGDRLFVAMEHVAGANLRQWLAERPRPWRGVLAVFLKAGRGLAAAHAAGIIHRDFKPDNVLVGRDGRVQVADFGLARAVDDAGADADGKPPSENGPLALGLTRSGQIIGTPLYMAPEIHRGERAGAPADQFAFCVALYEALYGQRPFAGSTRQELAAEAGIGRVRPPPPGSKVPAWLRARLLRGLRPDPAERFPSMDALLAALADDPQLRRQRIAAGVGVFALGGVALFGLLRSTSGPSQVCRGAEQHLDGVWDDARRREVETALLASGAPYARFAADAVRRDLDRFAGDWTAMHVEACEATSVRREQPDEVLALRMACLERKRSQLRAVGDVLAKADKAVVERAGAVAASLGTLDRCADIEALRAAVPPPDDPATAATVDRLRARLDDVDAHERAGRYPHGLTISEEVAEASGKLDYPPMRADALYWRGLLRERSSNYTAAATDVEEAYWIAYAARHDDLLVDGALVLLATTGHALDDAAAAERWAKHARAAIERAGKPAKKAAQLESYLGLIRHKQGKLEEALAHHERALAIAKQASTEEASIAAVLNNIGQVELQMGHNERGIEVLQQALALKERSLGPDHPDLGSTLTNLAVAYNRIGKFDQSRSHYLRALELYRSTLGPDHVFVARTLMNLGALEVAQGDYAGAEAHHRQALAGFEKALPAGHANIGSALLNLAIPVSKLGRHAEARDLLARALGIFTAALGADHAQVGMTRQILAGVLTNAGDHRGALRELDQALAIYTAKLGPEHRHVADVITTIGQVRQELRDWAGAQREYERALPLYEKALGTEHAYLAYPLVGIGETRLATGRAREAIAPLERALTLREGSGGQAAELAQARFTLARALWADGGDRARARTLAEAALADYSGAGPGFTKDVERVKTWLAAPR